MGADHLISKLEQGRVYRRDELMRMVKAEKKVLKELLADGAITKLYRGLYYCPKLSQFGPVPVDDNILLRAFLKTERFLLLIPHIYNGLGLGATQLYNQRIVYNQNRRGEITIGNRTFTFKRRTRFPSELTVEFLLVNLVEDVELLPEERETALAKLPGKVRTMDGVELAEAVNAYGGVRAKKYFSKLL